MRSSLRVPLIGIPLVVLLALPAIGVADSPKDPVREPGSGAQVTLSGGTNVAIPAAIPGAKMGTLGDADVIAYYNAAGGTVITAFASSVHYEYNSNAGWPILAPLGLPVGAALLQIDAYGYTTGATNQTWILVDQDTSTGADVATFSFPATSTGPGLVQSTKTFPSGLTLAAGHNWAMDLPATDSTSGFVGAIFQYILPTLSLVPITPTRVLDTRNGTGGLSGPFTNHAARTFQVTGGSSGVPVGARAVVGNLTVTGQTSSGYLYIGPVAMNNPTSSTLNFPAGDDRANGVTVALGAGGTLSITFVAPSNGPAAHAIFDVTGYYQ
jgi:hypothetical protein